MDCSPPGSSVHGILQARIQEWVAISFSRGSSGPRDGTCISLVSCFGRCILYHEHHLGYVFTEKTADNMCPWPGRLPGTQFSRTPHRQVSERKKMRPEEPAEVTQ